VLAIVLALLSALGYGGSDYAAGLATRAASVLQVTVLSEAASVLLLLLIVPWASSQPPTAAGLWWGVAAGVSGVVGAMALYLGFRHAAFSVASSLSAVGSAAFAVLAGLLLGERPGTLALVGIGLALPAIVAVSASPGPRAPADIPPAGTPPASTPPASTRPASTQGDDPARPRLAGNRNATGRHALGVIFGLIAGAGFAGLFIALNRAGSGHDLWPVVTAQGAALVTAFCVAAVARQLSRPAKRTLMLATICGTTGGVGTIFFFIATHLGLLAVTAVITSLYPASTIVLARGLLGERLTPARIAGLGLAAASVVLIAVGGAG
jgi:drug/metabolite transporter (DMT)-like permease